MGCGGAYKVSWVAIFHPSTHLFILPLLRDAGLATEFVNSLKKVGPSLGMTVGNPKEFKLTDNRPATYVQTLDQVIKMGPSIIMVVIPNNKVHE